jgi:hypothetical protein
MAVPSWLRAVDRSAGLRGFVAASLTALIAGPLGYAWGTWSPLVQVRVSGTPQSLSFDLNKAVTSDVAFLCATAGAGILSAILAFVLVKPRSPFVTVGLALGGALGSLVARAIGVATRVDRFPASLRAAFPFHAQNGSTYTLEQLAGVYATAALIAWALAAVGMYSILVALIESPDPEPVPEVADQASWSAAPYYPPH